MKKTYLPKNKEIKRSAHIMDASQESLGRLAVQAARFLIGKNKIDYTPNYDLGDNVIITNAKKLVLTGKKLENKKYYRHSWYPGGLTTETAKEKLKKDPASIIKHAIKGMLPKNKLQNARLKRLQIKN